MASGKLRRRRRGREARFAERLYGLYGVERTLYVDIPLDGPSGLPLLETADELLKLAVNYLPLPYSIVEYGCGQKASILMNVFLNAGAPAYALRRGMILERDLSAKALASSDYRERDQPLLMGNPLYRRIDLEDEVVARLLREAGAKLDRGRRTIEAGPYCLHHERFIQFAQARSHIVCSILCWDEEGGSVVERVVDPTLDTRRLITVEEARERLQAPDALFLQGPLLGRFRLAPQFLTEEQRRQVETLAGDADALEGVSWKRHCEIVRIMTGAEEGSLGDPETWSYFNNAMVVGQDGGQEERAKRTGEGEPLRPLVHRLLRARVADDREILQETKANLQERIQRMDLQALVAKDAVLAEEELAPLAEVVIALAYSHSLEELAHAIESDSNLAELAVELSKLIEMHGIGVRLRTRMEELAHVSRDSEGRIDARALNERYFLAAAETVRQMQVAGLTAFIDRVGNLHGLRLGKEERALAERGELELRKWCSGALAFVSHIDTVFDAGKLDGRLGVLSGIEMAQLLRDLDRLFGMELAEGQAESRMMVSAFCGEEMTFTGEGVSLPGSAAVAGLAEARAIYRMSDAQGETYGDRLVAFLRYLQERQREGAIELANPLAEAKSDRDLLQACSDPESFFAPCSFERHIEQGPLLDRASVPLAPCSRIMGIAKEDYFFEGELAELAGLEFNRGLRTLAGEPDLSECRVTVGIFRNIDDEGPREVALPFAFKVAMRGRQDHAGSTLMADRRDAGVALGRLAGKFLEMAGEQPSAGEGSLEPLVAKVTLFPGTNRNVVPGRSEAVLGLSGKLSEQEAEALVAKLEAWAVETLSPPTREGGEGVRLARVEFAKGVKLEVGRAFQVSTDLRMPEDELGRRFRERMRELAEQLADRFGVKCWSEPRQTTGPVGLEESGQLLQIERSFGGSHNPAEGELAADVLRGTLVQLAVMKAFMAKNRAGEGVTPLELARELMPGEWRGRVDHVVSGALHDTANIARGCRAKAQVR